MCKKPEPHSPPQDAVANWSQLPDRVLLEKALALANSTPEGELRECIFALVDRIKFGIDWEPLSAGNPPARGPV